MRLRESLAVFPLLLLIACPDPIQLQTTIVTPVSETFTHGKVGQESSACLVPCFSGSVETSGTGPNWVSPNGQFAIGYEHTYDAGTKPCPCWAYRTYVYRGRAAIKLADLPANVVTATLLLDVKKFERSDGGGSQNGLISGMYRQLAAPIAETADFETPLSPLQLKDPLIVPFPASIPAQFPKGGPSVMKQGSVISIDVSVPVRDAIKQKQPFINFIFVGPDESLHEKTEGVFAAMIEPKLKVLFKP